MTIEPSTIDEKIALHYSGSDKRQAGVGRWIYVGRSSRQSRRRVPANKRLAVITVNGTIRTHIIAVYASTETSPDSTEDDFYVQLQHTLDSLPQMEVIGVADINSPLHL